MKADTIQKLMDQAYARWSEGMGPDEFWAQLSAAEEVAVATGNLNYQVENGGFSQWLGNRYATPASVAVLRATLARCGEPGEAGLKILNEFLSAIAWDQGEYDESALDDEDWDTMQAACDRLSSAFYKVNTAMVEAVDAYVAATFRLPA